MRTALLPILSELNVQMPCDFLQGRTGKLPRDVQSGASEGNPAARILDLDEPPVSSKGGKGVVVPGCSICRKRANTISDFLEHIAHDAIPPLIERLSQILER